jgi:hypothetical protein
MLMGPRRLGTLLFFQTCWTVDVLPNKSMTVLILKFQGGWF